MEIKIHEEIEAKQKRQLEQYEFELYEMKKTL